MAASLALSACEADRNKHPAPPEPAVYRHGMDGAPSSLDPAQASNIYANFLAVNLYDTLYRYKYLARPYALEPNLAESLPRVSADGLTYTIRIKQGVHYVDDDAFPGGKGRELRAEDFVYSIKRHFDPAVRAQGAWLWQGRIVGLDEWKDNGSDYDDDIAGLLALDERTPMEAEVSLLLVTVMRRLFLGLTPFWGTGDAPLACTWIDDRPRRLLRRLPALLRG
ncbi:MAG: ABC transporter substrate-binding protein, partial [Xanthomonadales bacterium]|nr:ABC transporter substrate-binding protein [Xanthomonadales bacterium]